MSNRTVSYDEDQGAMQILYDITNLFLHPIIRQDLLPSQLLEENIQTFEDFSNLIIKSYPDILRQNTPMIASVAFGFLLALLSLIIGISFCCRCKKSSKSKKKSTFLKGFLSTLGFLIIVIATLGVAWFSVSAVRFEDGLKNINQNISNILHDADLFINTTTDEMSDVFNQTFAVFNAEFDDVEFNFTEFIATLKGEIRFNVIQGNLETFSDLVQNYANDIKPTMENALDSIANINNTLTKIKTSCASLCDDVNINRVLGENFYQKPLPKLPDDIQTNLGNFARILSDVDQAISTVDIAGQLAGLRDQILSIRAELDDLLNSVRNVDIFRTSFKIPNFISTNVQYINIAVLAVGGFLSLVLALVLLGLTCGGRTKSGSGPAKTGASLSCGALSVFFPAAALLFVLCAALLLVGGLSEKVICQSLRQPDHSQVFQLAEKVLQQNVFKKLINGTINLSISEIIHEIHNNTPLYPLLSSYLDDNWKLEARLRNWREKFSVNDTVDDFKEKMKKITNETVEKIKEDNPNLIDFAAEIDQSLNPVIKDILQTDVATAIQKTITQIREDIIPVVTDPRLKDSLRDLIFELTTLENTTNSVKDSFNDILQNPGIAENENLTLGKFVNGTFALVDEAFTKIPENVSQFVDSTVESLLETIDRQVPWIVSSVEHDVGKTEVLSNIYNATYTLACLDIIAPLNSVWSGLGLTLLLILFPLLLLLSSRNKIVRSHRSRGEIDQPYNLSIRLQTTVNTRERANLATQLKNTLKQKF